MDKNRSRRHEPDILYQFLDTLSALIVPSCTITISNHAEESAVPIALPENMTTVTALPVPAISQTVNEHIEIPHFRLLSPAELSALGSSKGKDKKAKEQVRHDSEALVSRLLSIWNPL